MTNHFSIRNKPDYGPNPHDYDDIALYETVQLQRLAAAGLEHFDNLVTSTSREPNKMPEYVFVKVFLPFFCNEPTPVEVGPIREGNWVTFAGGAFMPVDVVNEQNEVLFTVPPRFDNNSVAPPHVNDMNNYVTVNDQYHNLKHAFPQEAQRLIEGALAERADVMRTNIRTLENLYAWNNIFKRYGRPLITYEGKSEAQLLGTEPWDKVNEIAEKQNNNDDEEFQFGSF